MSDAEQLRESVSLVRYVDRAMVDGLRQAVAAGEPFTVTLCPPGARDLLALIDALVAVAPQHRCLAVREWQPPPREPLP